MTYPKRADGAHTDDELNTKELKMVRIWPRVLLDRG